MVGFHGNIIYQMKEKVICYIMIYSCYGLFAASNSYDFFNQYCSNLLKNPTVGADPTTVIDLLPDLTYGPKFVTMRGFKLP